MPAPLFHLSTAVTTSRGGLRRAVELVPARCRSVMVVTGAASAERAGHIASLVAGLDAAGTRATVFRGVEENPAIKTVDRGVAHARACGADALIGLGGGSALDAAKAIAVCAAVAMPARTVLATKPAPRGCIWFLAIPTTAGTGSEVTPYALLTDTAVPDKVNLSTPDSLPAAALLDAELTVNMPARLTCATGVDALSHAVEGMLSLRAQPLTDALAIEAVRLVGRALPRALAAPGDLDAREQMLVASCLAGMVIAQTGTTACHALSYYLTLHHGVHHGHACGMLLGAVVDWARPHLPGTVRLIEEALGSPVPEFMTRCGLPGLAACNLGEAELDAMAASAAPRSNVQSTVGTPSACDLGAIARAACAAQPRPLP